VLCPDGSGTYHVGEITSDYSYVPDQILPHRRSVQWFTQTIDRTAMSEELWNSIRAGGMISDITRHQNEIDKLNNTIPTIVSNDPSVEDPAAFAMEKHLEEFLVQNWVQTDLSKEYNIYEEDGEQVGQQYPTDTGPIDILAISKDKKRLLVVELKKGRASDVVVGQTLRYMGYVQEELAETGQSVSGVIIALEDDQRLRRALAVVPSINFYRYQISFKLVKTQFGESKLLLSNS
jgi:restriction system protein